MSLITRCPACNTLYKVVPDQLRISEGWVKCGQCSEIFDASQHLFQSEAQLAAALKHPFTDEYSSVAADTTVTAQVEPDIGSLISTFDHGASLALTDSNPQSQTSADTELLEQPYIEIHPDAGLNEAALSVPIPEPERQTTISFLDNSNINPGWHRLWVRGLLIVMSGALLFAVLGQWVFHERSRLVSLYPEARPVFESICEALGCSVPPLQRIESMVIDSAAFDKLGKDSFRLNFSVKNVADLNLAVPDIELTLTDSADQPVLRRILSRTELGSASETLPGRAEWPVVVTLRIKTELNLPKVVGYRLVAFYP